MGRSGSDIGDPDQQAVRAHQGLDVAAEVAGLAGVPHVDGLAFAAGGLGLTPVGGDERAVEDDVGSALGGDPVEGLMQVWSLLGQDGQG